MTTIGPLLKEWRQRRHLSQLDLALDAEISQRHLSFVESGRARPSREMVLRLAERLSVPLRVNRSYSDGLPSPDLLWTIRCCGLPMIVPLQSQSHRGGWRSFRADG